MKKSFWNPRYTAYAKANGKTESEMITHDNAAMPGGNMANFMIWVQGKWREWKDLNHLPHDFPLRRGDHDAFDRWLSGEVTK